VLLNGLKPFVGQQEVVHNLKQYVSQITKGHCYRCS